MSIESALQAAAIALGLPPGARFQLREIDVEEVSLVDRPANRHRFLVVKHEQRDSEMTVKLTEEVKKALLETLATPLEGLAAMVQLVKAAEVITDEAELPEPISQGLLDVAKAMMGTADTYPTPLTESLVQAMKVSDLGSETADKLKLIGALIMQVAEADSPDAVANIAQMALAQAAEKSSDGDLKALLSNMGLTSLNLAKGEELDDAGNTALSELAVALTALVAKNAPAPVEEPKVEPKVEPQAQVASELPVIGNAEGTSAVAPIPQAQPPQAPLEPLVDPVITDEALAAAAPVTPAAPVQEPAVVSKPVVMSGAKMSEDNVALLTQGIEQLQTLLTTVTAPPEAEPAAVPEPTIKSEGPSVVEKALMDKLEVLTQKVTKMQQRPVAPSAAPLDPPTAAPATSLSNGSGGASRGGPWVWGGS